MDEEGIVGFGGAACHAHGCRFDELIRGTFDEVLESVKGIEFDVWRVRNVVSVEVAAATGSEEAPEGERSFS